jgi:hypothetical protein
VGVPTLPGAGAGAARCVFRLPLAGLRTRVALKAVGTVTGAVAFLAGQTPAPSHGKQVTKSTAAKSAAGKAATAKPATAAKAQKNQNPQTRQNRRNRPNGTAILACGRRPESIALDDAAGGASARTNALKTGGAATHPAAGACQA